VTTQFVHRQGRGHRRQVAAVTGRALREFGAVPLLVMAGFGVLAVVSILGDQVRVTGLDAARAALSHVIGKNASTTTLQAVATGLVTVTSITFSVLLLAVQQTASSLSPVVFDQFIRRRTNQAFLGFFVGLALYAYVVMAAVQDKTPPIIGAFLATALTVVAMVFLLALVYTSINQMRPANVVRQIHDRVLQAREREAELVRRTQREPDESLPVQAAYRSARNGYVTGIGLPRLARTVQAAPEAQLQLHVTVGQYVSFGDTLATLRSAKPADADAVAQAVGAAVLIEPQRNLDHDATTGIDELGNIAWTSGSTSKQNPEVSREAMYCLRDIAARWLEADPARLGTGPRADLPIVYPDNDFDRICETFYSLLVVAHESQQHMQAARVLETYGSLIERAPDEVRSRLQADLDMLAPVLREVPQTPLLSDALQRLPTSPRQPACP
jgi:Predicted membrane protein (DUF2254)